MLVFNKIEDLDKIYKMHTPTETSNLDTQRPQRYPKASSWPLPVVLLCSSVYTNDNNIRINK